MNLWLLAQGGNADGGGFIPLPILIGILVLLFWVVVMRPEQKKRKDHQSQLESLAKHDRVVTIGGIYGIVTNVQRDLDKVKIRVDETNNTELEVTLAAIARVVPKDKPADA